MGWCPLGGKGRALPVVGEGLRAAEAPRFEAARRGLAGGRRWAHAEVAPAAARTPQRGLERGISCGPRCDGFTGGSFAGPVPLGAGPP